MPLLNYTTEVPAAKSIAQIHANLVAHGARSVLVNYLKDGEPASLSFIIETDRGQLPFRLPANVEKVRAVLLGMRAKKPEPWMHDYQQIMDRAKKQATRVAWRIVKSWVDAQLAIIETEMVKVEEVFLPYLLVKDNQTLFEAMEKRGFYLPEGRG